MAHNKLEPLDPGALVQGSSAGVYVIQPNKTRQIIPIPGWLEAGGFRWEHVINVTDTELDAIKFAKPQTYIPDGGLFKSAISPGVYIMDRGKRRGFTSGTIFETNGFDWNAVVTIPDADVLAIPEGTNYDGTPGSPIPNNFPTGSLVKDPDLPEVYVIHDNCRRWIPSMDVLLQSGFDPATIQTIGGISKSVPLGLQWPGPRARPEALATAVLKS